MRSCTLSLHVGEGDWVDRGFDGRFWAAEYTNSRPDPRLTGA